MCIIVSKEKGVNLPSKEILKRCFDYNNDGAGLMFVDKGRVNIVKGFMTFKGFYEYLTKLDKVYNLKEKALVMHFRISTAGNVDSGNCHPYPVSFKKGDLRSTCIQTHLGMAHNGIINMYSRGDGDLNDTQTFIQKVVMPLYTLNKEFYKNESIMNMLDDFAGSKLCFLDSNENIYYVGKFIEDDGVMYSNTSYMPYTYYPTAYGCYDSYYDDYYDEYYYGKTYDKKTKKNNSTKNKQAFKTHGDEEKALSEEEFEYFLDFMTFLDKGTVIESCYREKFEIDSDNMYAFDPYFNLHLVDFENHDMFQLYDDCCIIKLPNDELKEDCYKEDNLVA